MLEFELAQTNGILPPKGGRGAYRLKINLPYLENADYVFSRIWNKSFYVNIDGKDFEAVLNQDVPSPFKILPGDLPLIEICIEVFGQSFDELYKAQSYYLKIEEDDN